MIEKIKNFVLENLNDEEKNELMFDIISGYNFSEDLEILTDSILQHIDYVSYRLCDDYRHLDDDDYDEMEEFYRTFENFKEYYINYMDYYINEMEYYEYEGMLEENEITKLNKYIEKFWYKLFNFIYKQLLKKYELEIDEQIVSTYKYIKEECFQ